MSELYHFGTPHEGSVDHSGRYPHGSGENPYQHSIEPLSEAYRKARANGMSETEFAAKYQMSTTELRKELSRQINAERAANISQAKSLKEHGYSVTKIAEMMEQPERTIYNWLSSETVEKNAHKNEEIANTLKVLVDEKGGYLDIGKGTEYLLGTTRTRLDTSAKLLEEAGYSVHTVKTQNVTDPSKFTYVKVLCKPDTTWGYIQNHQELIQPIKEYSTDGGKTLQMVEYPASISSDRVGIRYAEDGGKNYDGVMYIRRGVKDLSLGDSNYAQVRIAVDGTHYLKGMAMYSDDLPDGMDILFNTNKSKDKSKLEVLKPLKDSEDLPFGAVIAAKGQSYYEDKDGDYVKKGSIYIKADKDTPSDSPRYSLSAINKLKEEGDWNEYSKTLSSQMLSKQSYKLIKKQLDLSYAEKRQEYDEIMSLTQPEIKKMLLMKFSEDCDSSAVDLKAVALPGQTSKVILPLTCMKDDQIYAPGYSNGTQVALIRYPHAGLFEIPILTVNNNNKEAKRIMGNTPIDAVGITNATASKLSGADFDGDTVVVIPLSDKVKIDSQPSLEYKDPRTGALRKLSEFDPKEEYPGYPGMQVMTAKEKGREMGKVSNLITDMTLQGAPPSDIARAVRHSMVVIDAEKHKLNWKLSEQENGIQALKQEYQGGKNSGASTIISKASSTAIVDERAAFQDRDIDPDTGYINRRTTDREYKSPVKLQEKDPETGKKVTVYTTNQYGKEVPVYKTDSDGNVIYKIKKATEKSTKMAEAKDAFELSSGTKKESAYAEYANSLKQLANEARLSYLDIPNTERNKSAKETYAKEIESLNSKLELASLNAPKERSAQLIANKKVKEVTKYVNLDDDSLKKLRQQSLASARTQTGANKKDVMIKITDSEWEAIQNGALSSSTLKRILENTDTDEIRKRATPRTSTTLSQSQVNLIKARAKSGFTIDEIAQSMGLSSSTITKYIKD